MEATIANRIRLWRQALGLTQQVFSAEIGLHIGVLKKYETGINQPGTEALAAIAKTGVNLHWLVTGEGDMHHPAPQQPSSNQSDTPTKTGAVAPVSPLRVEDLSEPLDALPAPDRARLLQEFLARATDARQLAELRQAVAELRSRLPP